MSQFLSHATTENLKVDKPLAMSMALHTSTSTAEGMGSRGLHFGDGRSQFGREERKEGRQTKNKRERKGDGKGKGK